MPHLTIDHAFALLYVIGAIAKALLPSQNESRIISLMRAQADLLMQLCGKKELPATKTTSATGSVKDGAA